MSTKMEGLKREIGTLGLASTFVNFIVGAGIYALPAYVAISIGSAALLAFVICGILITLIMLCFAEIGTKITVSGGPYAYIQQAFGKYAGFLSNITFWFGYAVLADAAIANAMVDMLATQFPIFQNSIMRAGFFFIMFGTFALVNIRGVKQGVNLIKTLTAIKLLPLIFLVLYGIFFIDVENLAISEFPTTSSLGEACILLFFAFGGGEGALSASGEIRNPGKTIPKGILIGILGVILLYMAIQMVCQGVLGPELGNFQEAPLAETLKRVIGPVGAILMIYAAAFSIFSTLSGSVNQYPRVLYAGARDRVLPGFLSKIHTKYLTPMNGIIVYALLDFIVSVAGGFKGLAIISSAALLLIYFGVVAANIKLRKMDSGGFKLIGGITIPAISLIIISWFLFQLSSNEWIAVLIFMALLSIIYLLKVKLSK